MKYCEMGGLLRTLQSTDNPIGNYLKVLTEKGLLIKDEIVSGLRGVFMQTLESGDVVLGDGVLRKLRQTQQIVSQMWDADRKFIVIHIELPEEEVYKRLHDRLQCKACGRTFSIQLDHLSLETPCPVCGGQLYRRGDDTEQQAVKTRIEAFYRDTVPVLEWLEEQGVLVRVDGMQTPEQIFSDILQIIEQ
jgi:adenylate kinase